MGVSGSSHPHLAAISTGSTEDLIPADDPICKIRVVVDTALAELDSVFAERCATGGPRSTPPESLLDSPEDLANEIVHRL